MEAKASRMSQRSNAGQASVAKVGKTISKASLSPSQMSERSRMAAANKDPLDALSRAGMRQTNAERRSGLQDVDDEYLKTVVYAFAKQTNQSAAERAKVTADMMPAGVPTTRSANRTNITGEQRLSAGNEAAAAAGSTAVVQEQVPAQMQAQIQQNQQAAPAQMQAQVQQIQQPPSAQMQAQASNQAQTPPATATQDAIPPEKSQTAQKAAERQSGGGDPELYTTCPNCRATLYLVRNASEPSPYANQQGDMGQSQSQLQAQAQQQH